MLSLRLIEPQAFSDNIIFYDPNGTRGVRKDDIITECLGLNQSQTEHYRSHGLPAHIVIIDIEWHTYHVWPRGSEIDSWYSYVDHIRIYKKTMQKNKLCELRVNMFLIHIMCGKI